MKDLMNKKNKEKKQLPNFCFYPHSTVVRECRERRRWGVPSPERWCSCPGWWSWSGSWRSLPPASRAPFDQMKPHPRTAKVAHFCVGGKKGRGGKINIIIASFKGNNGGWGSSRAPGIDCHIVLALHACRGSRLTDATFPRRGVHLEMCWADDSCWYGVTGRKAREKQPALFIYPDLCFFHSTCSMGITGSSFDRRAAYEKKKMREKIIKKTWIKLTLLEQTDEMYVHKEFFPVIGKNSILRKWNFFQFSTENLSIKIVKFKFWMCYQLLYA